jgi:hypothetical protein
VCVCVCSIARELFRDALHGVTTWRAVMLSASVWCYTTPEMLEMLEMLGMYKTMYRCTRRDEMGR